MARKIPRNSQPKANTSKRSKSKKRAAGKTKIIPSGHRAKQGEIPAHLTPGNPGHDGRAAGANPNWLSRFAKRVLRSKTSRRTIKRIIRSGDKSPAYSTVFKELARRGYGEVAKTLDVNAKISLEQLVAGSYTKHNPESAE